MENTSAFAMVFENPNSKFIKEQVEVKDLSPNEVLVKVQYTTICTSDLHTFSGRRSGPCPSVLGHEIIGKVLSIGENFKNDFNGQPLSEGDLVTWCVYSFDKNDEMAKKGIPQKSASLYKYGHHKFSPKDGLNGGFASHCLLREGTAIFKLDPKIDMKILAPLNCTHATIAAALRLAGDIKGKNVLITGLGMLGLSACAMAKEVGAKKVFGMDINAERMQLAQKFGVDQLLNAADNADTLKATFSAEDKIDLVIDTTGLPQVMETGIELLNIGGTSIFVGAVYTQPKTQINAELIVRNIITIKGIHNYAPADLAFAIEFIEKTYTKYPFENLVGTDFGLEEIDTAFAEASNGKHYRVGINQN